MRAKRTTRVILRPSKGPSAWRGKTGTPEYRVWAGMLARCYNPKASGYSRYGGRGITVCDRWRYDLTLFVEDMGPRPEGATLDRIDPDGDYCPNNCRWATWLQQGRNRRGLNRVTFRGRTLTLAEWVVELGINRGTLQDRLDKGWTVERAFTTPVDTSKRNRLAGSTRPLSTPPAV